MTSRRTSKLMCEWTSDFGESVVIHPIHQGFPL